MPERAIRFESQGNFGTVLTIGDSAEKSWVPPGAVWNATVKPDGLWQKLPPRSCPFLVRLFWTKKNPVAFVPPGEPYQLFSFSLRVRRSLGIIGVNLMSMNLEGLSLVGYTRAKP